MKAPAVMMCLQRILEKDMQLIACIGMQILANAKLQAGECYVTSMDQLTMY